MAASFSPFVKATIILSAISIAGLNFFYALSPVEHENTTWVVAYYGVTTLIIGYFIAKALSKKGQESIPYYFAIITAKFLAALIIILIYFLAHKKLSFHFSITFVTCFILFTVIEVFFSLKYFKN